MRARLAVAAAIASVATAAACLPSRDNPNDPAHAPIASLAIYVETSSGLVAAEGNEHTTFLLDASASSDPHGNTPRSTWSYSFDLGAGAGAAPQPSPVTCPDGSAPGCFETTLTIDTALLPASGVGSAPRFVTLDLDIGGRKAQAKAFAILENRLPIVDAGGDLEVPRARAGNVVLDPCGAGAFGCTSSDPEGDALTWSWSQLRGDAVDVSHPDAQGRVTFVVPTDEQDMVFRLDGFDGHAHGSQTVHVRVGAQIWATTTAPTALWSIPSEYAAALADETDAGLATTAVAADPRSGAILYAASPANVFGVDISQPPRLFRRTPRGGLAAFSEPLASGVIGGVAALEDGSLCIAATPGGAFRIHADGSVVAPVGIGGPAPSGAELAFADPGTPGACWIADTSGDVWRLADDDTITAVVTQSHPGIVQVAPDGADGIWEAWQDPSSGAPTLLHATESGAEQDLLAGPSVLVVDALSAAAPDDAVWLHYSDGTFERASFAAGTAEPIVLDGIAPGARVTFAPSSGLDPVSTRLAGDPTRHALASDPALGWVFAADDQGTLAFFSDAGDGTLALRATQTASEAFGLALGSPLIAFREITLDARLGRIVALIGTGAIGALPADGRKPARVLAVLPGDAGYLAADPVRGAAWIAGRPNNASYQQGPGPARFDRMQRDGRLLASALPSQGATAGLAAQADGSIWIALGGVYQETLLFRRIDASGAIGPESNFPGVDGPSLEVPTWLTGDVSRGSLCAATFYYTGFGVPNAGHYYRVTVDTAAGIATASVALDAAGARDDARVEQARNGACWSIDDLGELDASPPAPGASFLVTSGGFSGPVTDLSADPRDASMWAANSDRVVRIGAGGLEIDELAVPAPFHADRIAIDQLCKSGPSCASWWIASGGTVAHVRADREVQFATQLPAGTVQRLIVAP